MKALLLFSGPVRNDGIDSFIDTLGAEAVVFDLERSGNHDLADEGVWSGVRDRIKAGEFHVLGSLLADHSVPIATQWTDAPVF